MTGESLEKRLGDLAGQVERLQHRVDELAHGMVRMASEVTSPPPPVDELAGEVDRLRRRVDELAHGMVRVATEVADKPHPSWSGEGAEGGGRPEDIVAWAGASSLLPRISTLCFLLVVALALRTVTDSGLVDATVGSVVGMLYAVSIMAAGWLRYRKSSAIAPVFSLCGSILMFSIIVETHSRFGSLATFPAYALIVATGVAMALTGRTAKSTTPVVLGTLGMCAAGMAILVPKPHFHLLSATLLAAGAIAYVAAAGMKRDWLRWAVFLLTGAVAQVWAFRLAVVIGNPDFPSPPMHGGWFFPAVAALALFYFTAAVMGMYRAGGGRKRAFDYAVPAMSAFVFFTAAGHVAGPLWGSGLALGAFGAVIATAHLGVASAMVRGGKLGALEFNSFIFAAVVLLVLSLSTATGALLAALPLLSAAAFHLSIISRRWKSGGTRALSYLLQAFVALALAAALAGGPGQAPPWLGGLAAGVLGVVAFLHYRWCRSHGPPAETLFFSRVDAKDYSASSLLLASLTGWFFLLRTGAYAALALVAGGGGTADAFSGAQSLLLNLAAVALLLIAWARRNREVRNVAILVVLVGGAKVFFYDLVGVQGIARVLSVFSFGIVAALASYVLSRWHSVSNTDAGSAPGTGGVSAGAPQ